MKTIRLPKSRDLTEDKYKWKLEDIYETTEHFEEDCRKTLELLPKLESFKGSLNESSGKLLECLALCDAIMRRAEDIYVYAKMKRDENTKLTDPQALADKADTLLLKAMTAASFIVPEITSLSRELLGSYMGDASLRTYHHFLENIIRRREHVLSEKEERIISMTGEILSSPGEIFTMFNNADIKFGSIKDEKGEKILLTHGNYISLLENKNRGVRREAYKKMYKSYRSMENTIARIYATNVKADKLSVDIRSYPSCLDASLDSDNIDRSVYTSLISAINARQPVMDRYLRLRKKLLGVKALRMYDVYVPIVDVPEKRYTYEEAKEIVLGSLAPLGEDYIRGLNKAFADRWVDVYETEGKKSGAYSWGSYDSHPYVLLNYQGTINDVFTIAHELGHALHSYYSNMAQEYINSSYPIFLAEVASTTNEVILMDSLISRCTDNREKAFLLNHYLEEFRTTVFRQTMFAEFELLAHEAAEKGEALTAGFINSLYNSLIGKHFGNVVSLDELIAYEWSRIPHFYTSFYVYKYATGFCAAVAIAKKIISGEEGAAESYIRLLSSGGRDYPVKLLAEAGVDLSGPGPVESALGVFENILDEMEKLI